MLELALLDDRRWSRLWYGGEGPLWELLVLNELESGRPVRLCGATRNPSTLWPKGVGVSFCAGQGSVTPRFLWVQGFTRMRYGVGECGRKGQWER